MEQHEIIKLSKKNIEIESLEKARKILENNYIISYGKYDATELKKAISSGSPVFIQDNFLIGFDPGISGKFVNSNKEKISIDRMVKAVIVEDVKADSDSEETGPEKPCMRDPFAIIGNNSWGDIPEFYSVIMPLRVGEIYLPPHSAIFNFLEPSAEEKKKKIVSMLNGVNICVYDRDNYIDNCIHEIGHLFWRDCLIPEEKKKFQDYAKVLRPSAIYQYEWERVNEEEIFCTIYKWYVKSVLVHPSFLNILEFEEPEGLKLFQSILERIAKDRMVNDIWESAKIDIDEYINPKYDIHHGRHIRRAGLLDKIKDIEVPRHVLNNVDRVEDGIEYINLGKAIVPVKNNKVISWENFEKAKRMPIGTVSKGRKKIADGKWIPVKSDVKKVLQPSQKDALNEQTLKNNVKIKEGEKWNTKKVVSDTGYRFITYNFIPKQIDFKSPMINDMNQNLSNGWQIDSLGEVKDLLLSRVLQGKKPMSNIRFWKNEERDQYIKEKNIDKIDKAKFDVEINDKEINITRKGKVGELFNLEKLKEDYKRAGIDIDIEKVKNKEMKNYFRDWDHQDNTGKVKAWETGLILGYPIENTISFYKGGIR